VVEDKIIKLGYRISKGPAPLAEYIPATKVNDLVFTAGQIPMENSKLMFAGKVGSDLTLEEGRKAAELCAVNCLRVIKNLIGELENIKRVVKVTVFVNSANGFTDQPKVANGVSEFLFELFGENARHVRSAVGVNELPINSAVEVEMIVQVNN
jgi:enamine deaminase RidA (YjgF/YER057c/UK114 family)